ncbi:hypothetical protein JCM19992_26790 [Thermostilla marina]
MWGLMPAGAVVLVVSVVFACTARAEAPPVNISGPVAQGAIKWAALADQVVQAYAPPTEEELHRARAVLTEAIARLDERLEKDPGGDAWRRYLRWSDFEKIASGEADAGTLDTAYARLTAGYEGLKIRCFADVADAIFRLKTLRQMAEAANGDRQFAAVVRRVSQLAIDYAAKPSVDTEADLVALVNWLALFPAAEPLVHAVAERFSQPNLLIQIDEEILAAAATEPVDTVQPVHELILGTDVHGTGHVTGTRTIELVPCSDAAVVNLLVRGQVDADTIGYNGPATIYSRAVSPFVSRKAVRVTAEGIEIAPTVTEATTSTDIYDIRMRCNHQLAQRIAWKRATKQKPQAEYISARRAEYRLNRQIDEQAEAQLAKPQTNFESKFREPLFSRGWFPNRCDFRTSDDALYVEVVGAIQNHPAAWNDAPPVEDGDLVVRVHQTFINNYAGVALAGTIVDEAKLQERLADLLGEVPDELKPEEGESPWTIFFSQRLPVAVQFDEGRVTVHFRGREYEREGSRYPGMNVSVTYRIEDGDGTIRLVREGDVAVFPPGFDPESGARLSVRQQMIRRMLQRRFEKLFPESTVAEPAELPGELAKVGKVQLTTCRADDGWLVLAWKRLP